MRHLAFLFTIYIMALSAWPCCEDKTSLSSSHEDVCLSSSERKSDSHENAHPCSPFFHASTYHAFVAVSAVTKAPALEIPEQNSNYPEYDDASVTLSPGDIWQPPQLV